MQHTFFYIIFQSLFQYETKSTFSVSALSVSVYAPMTLLNVRLVLPIPLYFMLNWNAKNGLNLCF